MSLSEEIDAADVVRATPPLPFVHTTSRGALEQGIAGKMQLRATHHCPVNQNQPALYLYYGLPTYRPKKPGIVGQLIADVVSRPIALIFRHSALSGRSADTYPFDTGAIHFGKYFPFLSRSVSPLPFRLKGDASDWTGKVVSHFFEKNEYYLAARPRCVSSFLAGTLSHKTANIYRNAVNADARRLSIEVVLNDSLQIGSDSLEGIIAPVDMRNCDKFAEFLRATNVTPEYYHVRDFNSADAEISIIIDKALDIYARAGYIEN
jgi:hypothetical protein